MTLFTSLSKECSRYIKVTTSQNKYKLDNPSGDCGTNKCETLIVTMTDFEYNSFTKKQTFISGLVHGDEVLGANILSELAILLCSYSNTNSNNYDAPEYVKNMLKDFEIIFTPTTNAYGYYHNIREELVNTSRVDPNRDFPYFNGNKSDESKCMVTIAARTVNEILLENLFINGISLHGGTNVIGYVWGNFIHFKKPNYSTEAPDYIATKTLGSIMQLYSDSQVKSSNTNAKIPKYVLGDMTSTVYAVDGGMEDWAYAGSWENKALMSANSKVRKSIYHCNPYSYKNYPIIKTIYDNNQSTFDELNQLTYQELEKNVSENILKTDVDYYNKRIMNKKDDKNSSILDDEKITSSLSKEVFFNSEYIRRKDSINKSILNLDDNDNVMTIFNKDFTDDFTVSFLKSFLTDKINSQSNSLKLNFYLIETNDQKKPHESTLGNSQGVFSYDNSKFIK